MNLQAPTASYGSRRSRVARRGERKFRPRVVQKVDQVYLVLGCARADFFKPPLPIVSLVLKVGSLRKHRVVVATEPIGTGNTSVARRWEAFPVVAGELALCRPDPHSAVEAVVLAVLVGSTGPITQDVGAGEVDVHFLLPGWFRDSYPMRLV